MGVMACDRSGCENVMCDRCILGRSAYICWECFAELEEARKTWPDDMDPREVEPRIREFMASPKPAFGVKAGDSVDDVFRRLTAQDRKRDRDEE